MKGIATGFRSFPTKSGDVMYVYNFIVPFNQNDQKYGAKGMDVKSYMTFNPLVVVPNEQYELVFEPDYKGSAQLVNAIHIEKGDKL